MAETKADNSPCILVVDDNQFTVEYIKELLLREGYSPLICQTGTLALEVARRSPIDLVLLDVVLNDMDGFVVAQQMRALFGTDWFVPIIFISALAGEKDKTAGLTYADDFITKPFSDVELLARVRSWLRIRRLQTELAASKRRYQMLYENAPYMYISLDREKKISNCNTVFCRELNAAKDAIIGRSIFDLFDPNEKESLEHFLALLANRAPQGTEPVLALAPPMSRPAPMLVSLSAVYIGEDEPGVWMVIAMQDVTARTRLEEEQRLARRQLHRSAHLASIGTLSSGVAHELNNPLTAVLGFSSSLLDRIRRSEAIPPAELEEYLSVINTESIRCRDIVDNLSKFAQDRESLVRDVSLADSIQSATRLIQARANKRKIAIVNKVAQDVLVRADSTRLSQVFVNILTNAIDFCSEGCVVEIHSMVSPTRPECIRITVIDNGPGIPAGVLPKIFDPFYTTKPPGQGTGLGLPLCHRIMQEFNGTIDILSEEGSGTTVVLEVPKSELEE